MTLTRRGESLLVALILIATSFALIAAAYIGQQWKQDRLQNGAGNTNTTEVSK